MRVVQLAALGCDFSNVGDWQHAGHCRHICGLVCKHGTLRSFAGGTSPTHRSLCCLLSGCICKTGAPKRCGGGLLSCTDTLLEAATFPGDLFRNGRANQAAVFAQEINTTYARLSCRVQQHYYSACVNLSAAAPPQAEVCVALERSVGRLGRSQVLPGLSTQAALQSGARRATFLGNPYA